MVIYKITNLVNGKIYIGQTSKSIDIRLNQHTAHKGCIYLHKAIKKYGKENFIIEEIYRVFKKEYLNEVEKLCINQYNSLVPNGYNICVGGNAPMENRKHTKEAKQKISSSTLGIKKSKEHSINISKAKLKNNPMFGRVGKKHHLSKKIICSNGTIYYSLHEAARELNLPVQNINKVLKKKRNTCGGYTFKYVEE